jgi:hypothetical protein
MTSTKIEIRIEGSNPIININIEQAQVRERKHGREIEGNEGGTEVHVQVKKARNRQ